MVNMRNISILLLLFFCFLPKLAISQDGIRVTTGELLKTGINYYNYSDPNMVNIEIIILGGVKNPGKYLVPTGISLLDFLSLTGGITKEEFYDKIKLIKSNSTDTTLQGRKIINIKFKKIFSKDFNEPALTSSFQNPILSPGDIIIVPIEEERTFWDSVKDALVFITPLISLASLLITLSRTN